MSEPQLERSVLEAKEREELFAIAEALGTRPTTRARKGDLVTAILRATGVEIAPESEPPRRTRSRRTPSKPAAEGASASAGPASDQPSAEQTGEARPGSAARAAGAEGNAVPVGGSARSPDGAMGGNGNREEGERTPSGQLPFESVGTGPTESGSSDAGSASTGGDAGSAGAESSADLVNGGGSSTASRPSGTSRPPRPPRTGYVASPDGGTAGSLPPSIRGRPGDTEAQRGGSDQSDSRPVAAASTRVPSGSPASSAESAPASVAASSGGSAPSVTVPAGDGQTGGPGGGGQGGGPESSPPAGASGSDGAEQRPRVEGETGNRRNRRRRGRDRGERHVERDLPNQNTDASFTGEPSPVSGYLDLRDEGYGFLRTQGYVASQTDVYVSISQVRRFSLRKGDWLEGASRPAAATEKYPALLRIDTVGGLSPDEARNRPSFDELTAVTPTERIALSRDDDPSAMDVRLIDLFAPLGRGQRALLAGPPRSGKTGVLVDIIRSLETSHPELQLLVLVVDERPEEVTELRRAIRSDVVATTFDHPAEEHVQVAELVIERAKRLVEGGADVVVVADGLTRLARAYNLVPSGSSRVLPGGIDASAIQRSLALFAAGRNIEDGGSLTMLATALIETGSRLDEVIYEESAAAANMQVRLDRLLARRNVRPAVDIERSWTRNEDRLLDGDNLERVRTLRLRAEDAPGSALEGLLDQLGTTKSNQEFLADLSGQPASEQPVSGQAAGA